MDSLGLVVRIQFYNHLILSGTKITALVRPEQCTFYNHLILSGTKISIIAHTDGTGFTIT